MSAPSFLTDLQPVVPRADQDHRRGAQRLGHRHRQQTDGAGADHHDAFARHQPAKFGEPVHRGSGGDDQRRLLVAHLIGNGIIVLIWLTAYSAKPPLVVNPLARWPFRLVAVIVARGIHPRPAAFALAAARVDFHCHPLRRSKFVNTGAQSAAMVPIYSCPGVKLLLNGAPPSKIAGVP